MWFFLVQTLVVLAAAMGLGVLAGWLLFGPASSSKVVQPVGAADSESRLSEGAVATNAAGIETYAGVGRAHGYNDPDVEDDTFSDREFARRDLASSAGDRFRPADVNIAPAAVAAIDNGPADNGPIDNGPADAGQASLVGGRPGTGTVDAAVESDDGASGDGASDDGASDDAATSALWMELESKSADVARLKLKLRRAVEEIERRTAQTVAAREARDAEHRRTVALEAQLAALPGPDTVPSVDQKTLLGLEADLERAKLRASHLAQEVEELAMSHAQYQSTTEAERQALTVEAASLRLRTEGALDQLNEFSRDIANFHAEHSQHLARSQQLMTELQAKLTVARSALAGRPQSAPVATAAPGLPASNVLPNAPVSVTAGESALAQLPGMSPELLGSLLELGVSSLHDVARWSAFDVQRIQGWLPEYPDVVEGNRWVERARALVRRERETAGLASGA